MLRLDQRIPFTAKCFVQSRLFLSSLPKWSFGKQIFRKTHINFVKIRLSGSLAFHANRQTDKETGGRTDEHDAVNSRCATAPKKMIFCSGNTHKRRIFAGFTAFLITVSRTTLHAYAVVSGPVRQAEVGLALPPAGFKQSLPPLQIYMPRCFPLQTRFFRRSVT